MVTGAAVLVVVTGAAVLVVVTGAAALVVVTGAAVVEMTNKEINYTYEFFLQYHKEK